MGHSNETPNLHLSQFVGGTDKPGWVADYNADMDKIDQGAVNRTGLAQGPGVAADNAMSQNASTATFTQKAAPTQWVLLKCGMTGVAGETQVIPDSSKYLPLFPGK